MPGEPPFLEQECMERKVVNDSFTSTPNN